MLAPDFDDIFAVLIVTQEQGEALRCLVVTKRWRREFNASAESGESTIVSGHVGRPALGEAFAIAGNRASRGVVIRFRLVGRG